MLSGETLLANFLGFGAFMMYTFLMAFIIVLVVYLFKAYALYTIAKKLGSKHAYLAWIPIAQFFIYPILADEKWEWGLIAMLPIALPFLFLPFAIIPFVNLFLLLLIVIGIVTLYAFRTYWIWKIFEKRNYHGALSLLTLINVACLIILGIVAWVDRKPVKEKVKPSLKEKSISKPKKVVKKTVKKKIKK